MEASVVRNQAVADLNVVELIRQALAAANQPISAAQIQKWIPKTSRPTDLELQSALAQPGIYKFPGRKGVTIYWDRSPEHQARQWLLGRFQGGPRTKADGIPNQIPVSLMLNRKSLTELLDELVQSGEIQKLPPFLGGRTALYSTVAVDPRDYLQDAFHKLARKLNVSVESLFSVAAALPESEIAATRPKASASPEESLKKRLLETIVELNPAAAQGDLVSIDELRQRLDFQIDRQEFDRVLLDLTAERKVALHQFDRPWMVSAEEREQLVASPDGRFFNAVSLWRQS